MPFRIFRTMLDDGPQFSMRYVELNESGQVVAWQADPAFTVEARNNVVKVLDEMRAAVSEPTIDEDMLWEAWDD